MSRASNQKDLLLKHLETRSINPREALNRYGIFRLAARIFELKEDGHDIATRIICEDVGGDNAVKFAEYRLVAN